MKTAFLFPGQGAQTAGMGADFANEYKSAAAIFDKANEILGYDLKSLCFNGPQEKLNRTDISQPAIFVTSAAILSVLREKSNITHEVTAGLSLGEYTALYAAETFTFEDALKLVQQRGTAMQQAAEQSKGSMVSVLGLDEEKVRQLCEKASQGQLLVPANFNCPGQIVISGQIEACHRAARLAEEFGAFKAIQLAVAGAFHTEMMKPAADKLSQTLDQTEINVDTQTKVIANVSGEYYSDPDSVRKGLVSQLVQPIQWHKCMQNLLETGVDDYYEIGPGRVLTGLMKKINRKTKVKNLSNQPALAELLEN